MTRPNNRTRYEAIWVTHTHWDREWYLSLERTRFRLVQFFDRLLKILKTEPEYHSFWLDGQTIPLDDYLAVCPERREELAHWIQKGKIRIGPWYVLADEHLVAGEACIRNLLRGRRESARWGQWNSIGYLPDIFGHMDQMPQILRGFGISNAVFWRGYRLEDKQGAETRWEGRDGSVVEAVCLVAGYSNARGFTAGDPEGTADRLDNTLPILKQHGRSGILLLMNGIDHALPTPRTGEVIQQVEKRYPDLRVRHGALDEFLERIRPYCRRARPLKGELFRVAGLDGCLSNRPDQKALNRCVENRLTHYAEPLAVMANASGANIPTQLLGRAWELLVQCHPHDTICGCHADAVARDMKARLEQALEIEKGIEREAVSALLGCEADSHELKWPLRLAIYNPLPWVREETVVTEIPVLPGTGGLVIRDVQGREWESRVLSLRPGFHTRYHDFKIPTRSPCQIARIVFRTGPLPAMGFRILTVEPAKPPVFNILEGRTEEAGNDSRCGTGGFSNVLENEAVRAVIHPDGTFDLLDKTSGLLLPSLHRLQIERDHGDLYRFAPALGEVVEAAGAGNWGHREGGRLFQSVWVKPRLLLDGHPLDVTLHFTLLAGKRRVEIVAEVHNTLRDFRLQVAFPAPCTGRGYAHTPFSISPRRPVGGRDTPYNGRDERLRLEATGQPMQFMAAFELPRRRALALYNRGLYEYTWEATERPCLTLMRAVGKITTEMAGHPAEGGQCPGLQRFEYAVAVASFNDPVEVLREAHEYNLEPSIHCVEEAREEVEERGFEFRERGWIPSAFKWSENGGYHVLRFWNASGSVRRSEIRLPRGYGKATRARLDETPLGEIPIRSRRIRLTTRPFEIVTILLEPVGAGLGRGKAGRS